MKTATKQLIGEFFASLFLGYLGLGVVVNMVAFGTVTGHYQFGISFGLVIACVVAIFNPISGAHILLSLCLWQSGMVFLKRWSSPTG